MPSLLTPTCSQPPSSALLSRARLDLAAERGGRVADVEEVAVDAGDGARAVGGLASAARPARPARPTAVGLTAALDRSTVRTCASYQPVWSNVLMVQRDARADRLRLVDQFS